MKHGTGLIRILAVDDHPLLRAGIAALIGTQSDMGLVAEASTGREAIETFRAVQPDITLLDLQMPELSGIDALIAIRSESPSAKVIVLTTYGGDALAERALKAGAHAYLLKGTVGEELLETDAAIPRVGVGGILINLDGEVVGIARLNARRRDLFDGMNHAIPADRARRVELCRPEEVDDAAHLMLGHQAVRCATRAIVQPDGGIVFLVVDHHHALRPRKGIFHRGEPAAQRREFLLCKFVTCGRRVRQRRNPSHRQWKRHNIGLLGHFVPFAPDYLAA